MTKTALKVVAIWFGFCAVAQAQTSLRFGIGGYAKIGSPAALWDATNPKAELLARAKDPTGARLVTAGRGTVLVQPGGPDAEIQIRTSDKENWKDLPVAGGVVRKLLRQHDVFVAAIGQVNGFEQITVGSESVPRDYRFVSIKPDELPRDPRGYQSLDLLIVAGQYDLPFEEANAIRLWVQSGGRLMVVVGEKVKQFQASPLATWIPIQVSRQVFVRDLPNLEQFAASTAIRFDRSRVRTAVLDVPSENGGAKVLAFSREGPLLAETVYGFGRVTVLGIDLDRPPLFYPKSDAQPEERWTGLSSLCRNILLPADVARKTAGREEAGNRRLSASGVTDLATQLAAAQEDFPGVVRQSHWLVLGWILGYIVLIGPLDYFLVRRVFKRPRLTWVTFPAWIAAASVFATWQSQRSTPDESRINQIDLVDLDASSGVVRTRSFVRVFHPRTGRIKLSMAADGNWRKGRTAQALVPTRMGWLGLPESTFGGMYRTSGIRLGDTDYLNRAGTELAGIPFPARSTRGFFLDAIEQLSGDPLFESNLAVTSTSQLEGTLKHFLPGRLENWILAHGNRIYFPRVALKAIDKATLAPGETFDPGDESAYRRDLRGFLTGVRKTRARQKLLGEDQARLVIQQQEYDPLSNEVGDVLRMITFHQSSGGSTYTGLSHGLLRELDLSPIVRLDRAVLFGKVKLPVTKCLVNGKEVVTHHETFIRVILPVRLSGSGNS